MVTTDARTVSVPMTPNLPSVALGEAVTIVLPTGSTVPGTVTAIGPEPPSPGPSSQSSGNGGSSGGSGGSQSPASQATLDMTVSPSNPAATGTGTNEPVQVALTTQSAKGVLAVPIAALLALAEGGYGVEVVGRTGLHHLVGVTTGVFTGSEVEITSAGLRPGTKVVVAQ
jgi:hypothetical protein